MWTLPSANLQLEHWYILAQHQERHQRLHQVMPDMHQVIIYTSSRVSDKPWRPLRILAENWCRCHGLGWKKIPLKDYFSNYSFLFQMLSTTTNAVIGCLTEPKTGIPLTPRNGRPSQKNMTSNIWLQVWWLHQKKHQYHEKQSPKMPKPPRLLCPRHSWSFNKNLLVPTYQVPWKSFTTDWQDFTSLASQTQFP